MKDSAAPPRPCPLCRADTPPGDLAEAGWLPPAVVERLRGAHPSWVRAGGACPACVQEALLATLLRRGDEALHDGIQATWPIDPEAAFGALPTPLRMHADPRYDGRGVTLAIVDAGFHPHPDLGGPDGRIRAWVDASVDPPAARRFGPGSAPDWPGAGDATPGQWHGLMTSAVAAGNGSRSHGLYRGLAPGADLVLLQVGEREGRITSVGIARALDWLREHGPRLGVRVVSLSVSGDAGEAVAGNPVDAAVARLVEAGICVVAAAGNDGVRRLVPPATAAEALTVGGLDDKNTLDHRAGELWHSNYGLAGNGGEKPELVAPSLWVVAPVLPGSEKAAEALALFQARAAAAHRAADPAAGASPPHEERLRDLRLVTPHYHLVEGTSVAAPLVAGIVACMLQANPDLTPPHIRRAILEACRPVQGAPPARQGRGAVDAGQAVARALREGRGALAGRAFSPIVEGGLVRFVLHDRDVREVRVCGSWDDWSGRGLPATRVDRGLWIAEMRRPRQGRHEYKYRVDEARWLDDPDNPHKVPDGFGRLNSVLRIDE